MRDRPENLARAARNTADVVLYVLRKYRPRLGFSEEDTRWAAELHLRGKALNRHLSRNNLKSILDGVPPVKKDRTAETYERLALVLSRQPVARRRLADRDIERNERGDPVYDYVPIPELAALGVRELRLTLVDFMIWEHDETAKLPQHAGATATANDVELLPERQLQSQFLTFEIRLPIDRYRNVRLTRDRDVLHYVTWRLAFERKPDIPMVAREVLTLRRIGAAPAHRFQADMTYRIGVEDTAVKVRTFSGYVVPFTRSLMCVMTDTDDTAEDWVPDHDRGRVIFMPRDPPPPSPTVRFGVLSSVRANPSFEPCAARTIMMLVEPDQIDDINEFRRRVTVLRSRRDIMNADFGGLLKEHQDLIASYIENIPEGYREALKNKNGAAEGATGDFRHNHTLQLELQTFYDNMKFIRGFILNPDKKVLNPIRKNWQEPGMLLTPEDGP